jgi:two-component sensor histidine kinase
VDMPDFARTPPFALPRLHLIEELNHRVVNAYSEAILSLSMAADRSTDVGSRQAFDQAIGRLQAHVKIHRALMPPVEADVVDLSVYLEALLTAMSTAVLEEASVRLLLKAEEVLLGAESCWRLGLIITELVRNGARHGLAGRGGMITVRISTKSGELRCLVSDNGTAVRRPTPGRGQRLIQSIAAELGASVDWRFTPNGCLVRVRLPLSADGEPRKIAGGGTAATDHAAFRTGRFRARPASRREVQFEGV